MILSITAITENLPIIYAEKEYEKDELSERDVAVLCGASEDYEENKEFCDNQYSKLQEEERERDEAGDHWLGGVTPDEFVDADKESDLG